MSLIFHISDNGEEYQGHFRFGKAGLYGMKRFREARK